MANVLLDMAMALDGFVSGPNGEEHGLHAYFFSPAGLTAAVIEDGFQTTGIIIMGRHSCEAGMAQDGFGDNPYQVPTFILTHRVPQTIPKGAESFVFVTGGIESALAQARTVTGDRDVVMGGGADIARQYLSAGLIDEIQIHLVHSLLGTGIRLSDQMKVEPVQLGKTRVVDSAGVTHMRFRVAK